MTCDHAQRVRIVPTVEGEDLGSPMWSCPCGAVSGAGGEMVDGPILSLGVPYIEGAGVRRVGLPMNEEERGHARVALLHADMEHALAFKNSPHVDAPYRRAFNDFRSQVNDVFEAYGATARELDALHRILGMDTPYPLADVLRILSDAIDHLHHVHDCDHHGWEVVGGAARAARDILRRLGHRPGGDDTGSED